MKELTVISGKGGTGKTSFLASFAALSKDSVIADCDVDASNLHMVLGPRTIRSMPIMGSLKAVMDPDLCIKCGLCGEECRFGAIDPQLKIQAELCEGCGVCEHLCPKDAIAMREVQAGTLMLSETRFGKLSHVRMKSGEEGSGKLVTAVRKQARDVAQKEGKNMVLVDGPPGIGCPVIASITGADLSIIVCEPSLSGLHDLKRVGQLSSQMDVPVGVCINKADVNDSIRWRIRDHCKEMSIPILGEVPYCLDFVKSMVMGKSVVEVGSPVGDLLREIWDNVTDMLRC